MKYLHLVIVSLITFCLIAIFVLFFERYDFVSKLNYLCIGWIIYMMTALIFLRRNNNYNFLKTWSHELIHTLFVIITRREVIDFNASSRSGGYIRYANGGSLTIISLSPYFFPMLSYILLLFLPMISHSFWPEFQLIIGITIGFYHDCFFTQARIYQSDLQKSGVYFSFIYIIVMNILCTLIIVFVISFGWSSVPVIILDGFKLLFN